MVMKMTIGGQEVMWLGDIQTEGSNVICSMYGNTLKSDIVQVSHHGYNLIKDVYTACAPTYGLVSNAIENLKPRTEKYNYFVSLVGLDKLYFAGDYTTAMAITNGKISIKKIPRYDNATGKL